MLPLLNVTAHAYAIAAANPRQHECMVWHDVKLREGKILIPSMVSDQTKIVEHPELIDWRCQPFASLASAVGKAKVIAGATCGVSQCREVVRLHPSVQWAKLHASAEGCPARRATRCGRSTASGFEHFYATIESIAYV